MGLEKINAGKLPLKSISRFSSADKTKQKLVFSFKASQNNLLSIC
jgi:hypothetical protein